MCRRLHPDELLVSVSTTNVSGPLHFYKPATHRLTGGSDPERNPVRQGRCLFDTLSAGGGLEGQELGQIVSRWDEAWWGTPGLIYKSFQRTQTNSLAFTALFHAVPPQGRGDIRFYVVRCGSWTLWMLLCCSFVVCVERQCRMQSIMQKMLFTELLPIIW